jgi:phosphoenolpyruvate carboxylase
LSYCGFYSKNVALDITDSDSAKDAGRLVAFLVQYLSQERMVEVAENCGIELCFFHGKGGTVGRGGNPALSHKATITRYM